tara:strand:- start:3128 stop:3385 length:258 start_codon:yes stop_codon:yes gene_type:complete
LFSVIVRVVVFIDDIVVVRILWLLLLLPLIIIAYIYREWFVMDIKPEILSFERSSFPTKRKEREASMIKGKIRKLFKNRHRKLRK